MFSNRTDEYKDTIIKEVYEELPKGSYPKVTIEEINNQEVVERSTAQGERTSQLAYEFVCYSRDMESKTNKQSVKFMSNIIDEYLQQNYKMQRLGNPVLVPFNTDKTVMTYIQRYSCVYDYETNLIYKN